MPDGSGAAIANATDIKNVPGGHAIVCKGGDSMTPERDDDLLHSLASATECTGLMPAQVEDGEQGENLSRLQAIHPIPHGIVDGKGKKE